MNLSFCTGRGSAIVGDGSNPGKRLCGERGRRLFQSLLYLLLGLAWPVFAQTFIPAQSGTYTLAGTGPFVLPSPNAITAPGSTGIAGNNTADWDLTIATGAAVNNVATGVSLGALSAGTVFNNSGSIAATSSGVVLSAGGVVNNKLNGTISSQFDGIYITTAGTVNNDGFVQGGATGSGVYFNVGGSYVGGSVSTITGPGFGIIVNAGTGSITNSGAIDVTSRAVVFRNGATGTIINQGGGIVQSQTNDAIHLVAAGSTVDNSGRIISSTSPALTAVYFHNGGTYTSTSSSVINGGYGVIINAGNGSVTNTGDINVANNGVWFRGNSTGLLTNQSGSITSTAASRAGVWIDSSGSVQIDNNASISGMTGIWLATGNHTLTNTGTIAGTAGTAISMPAPNGNNNTVTLKQGSTITGSIISTGSGNDLILEDSGTLASGFSGLRSVVVDAGAGQQWTLNGSPMGTSGTNITALDIQSGTLVLNGALTHAGVGGGTTVAAGAELQMGSTGMVGSVNGGDVVNQGTLVFSGPASAATVSGNLTNDGEVRMDSSLPARVLTVNGDYHGNNGQLTLNASLNGNSSVTDMMSIQSDTNGSTLLVVNNIGGPGNATTGDGILVVEVLGNSSGTFTLSGGAIRAGNYLYTLSRGMTPATAKNWYLTSLFSPLQMHPIPATAFFNLALLALGLLIMGCCFRRQSVPKSK